MNSNNLVSMANQIGDFFAGYGHFRFHEALHVSPWVKPRIFSHGIHELFADNHVQQKIAQIPFDVLLKIGGQCMVPVFKV